VLVYALLRRLTASRAAAMAAFVVMLLFIALDVETWEWNSLFPFVRRGSVSAGACVPALIVLVLAATRRVDGPEGRRRRRVALMTAPLLLVASLATHPLEMFPTLCFIAGVVFLIAVGVDRTGDRKSAAAVTVGLAAAAAIYLAIHARAVPSVAEYERERQDAVWTELTQRATDPLDALTGEGGFPEMLTGSLPSTAAVLGIPALLLAALQAPGAAAMLTLGIVPLALVYASPAGDKALTLLTSVETVHDVHGYFALLGLVALALGLAAIVSVMLRASARERPDARGVIAMSAVGSILMWAAVESARAFVPWLVDRALHRPASLLAAAIVAGAGVFVMARRRTPLVGPAPFPAAALLLTAIVAIPFAAPDLAFTGVFAPEHRISAAMKLRGARSSPSVLDWDSYYETLRQSIRPPLPVPREVVDDLRLRVPPRQVVLADPRYSCALVVLMDAYCINP
jgi:hypothetical protein